MNPPRVYLDSLPPFYSSIIIPRPRRQTYSQWFNSPIEDNCGYMIDKNVYKTHGDYIKYYYNNITKFIKQNGYKIKNEKEFKKEIATFIYRLSEENNALF